MVTLGLSSSSFPLQEGGERKRTGTGFKKPSWKSIFRQLYATCRMSITGQTSPPARYDSRRDVVAFTGQAAGKPVACAISREALDDHFGTNELDKEGKVQAVLKNRTKIEQMMKTKYLTWPIEEPDALLIKTSDVPVLIRSSKG